MIKETIFICSTCGQRFRDQKECEYCEGSHAKPSQILKYQYSSGGRYPRLVSIEMSDGIVAYYEYRDRQRA